MAFPLLVIEVTALLALYTSLLGLLGIAMRVVVRAYKP